MKKIRDGSGTRYRWTSRIDLWMKSNECGEVSIGYKRLITGRFHYVVLVSMKLSIYIPNADG
jgi:hypothetical protein